MAISGKRKIAMLLISLDAETAKDLLSDYPADTVQEIVMEMARLDATGKRGGDDFVKIMENFCIDLEKQKSGGMHVKTFLNEVLCDIENQANADPKEMDAFNQKDPFFAICSSGSDVIAKAIMYERPQIIALIISALPAKTATDVMNCIDPEVSKAVACKMALPVDIAPKTRHRIGEMVLRRISELSSQDESSAADMEPTENLRKVAMVLSGLEQDARDSLLDEIAKKDESTANTVKALMVTWDDIARIYDRSLQEALRSVEPSTLAKSFFGASEAITEKIRTNISERAAQTLDEEMALMQDPTKKEILDAREEVINPLREANETGQLRFIEG